MIIVVEDGTGLENANSYASVAEADGYWTVRGNVSWTGSETEKETALIKATDYIDLRWAGLLRGFRSTEEQSLEFPRTVFLPVPLKLKAACFEYALRALTAELAPDPTHDDSNKDVIQRSEGLGRGALAESVRYASSRPNRFRRYPVPDALMSPFINNSRRLIK